MTVRNVSEIDTIFLALDLIFAIILQIIFKPIQAGSVSGNMQKHFHEQRFQCIKLFVALMALALIGGLFCSLIASFVEGKAFALGVIAIAIGQLLQSQVAFTGGVQAAKVWFGRFLLAVLLKWLVVIAILASSIDSLKQAPLALLAGFVISLFVIQLFNFLDVKVKRGG